MDYQALADEQLVNLVTQADKRALSALYDRYSRVVYSLGLRMLGSKEAAEEITQDAFLKVWLGAGSYQHSKGKFSSWLLSITHNRAIDELRKSRRTGISSSCDDPVLQDSLADSKEEMSDGLINKLKGESVVEALEKLPSLQREPIKLAYFKGLTQAEIAREMSTPLGTIKTRMRLGLRKLRTMLVELEEVQTV